MKEHFRMNHFPAGTRTDFFGLDSRAQSEWNSLYLILVFAIAALLMIALIKPMFQQSQSIAQRQPLVGKN